MAEFANRNLLLVEDQLVISLHQKMELERFGYQVTQASSGTKAIETALDPNQHFDLILMDIDLGAGPDGIETAQTILDQQEIPILFLSSHIEPSIVAKTEQVSSYGYVVKNTGITVLNASIKMAFKLHESRINEKKAREQAEESLEQTKHNLEKVIENMLEGFILAKPMFNKQGEVIDIRYEVVNATVEKITGLSKADYIGNTAKELFNNNIEPNFFKKYDHVLKTGETLRFTQFFEEVGQFYELSAYKVDEQRLAIFFHDITERTIAEEAVKESEDKYRNLFDHMAHEVHFWKLVRDKHGKIKTWRLIDANPAALKAWGKTKQEAVGLTTDELFPDSGNTELFMPIVQKIFSEGKPHSWETYHEPTNQQMFMTSVPFGEYFVTSGNDITGNMHLKQQLEEKETLIKEALHRMKNNFSALISILSMQMDSVTNIEAANVLRESIGRIKSMHIIYEKLLLSKNYNNLNIDNYLKSLVSSIIELVPYQHSIKLNIEIADFTVKESYVFPLGAIVNELISNSVKHAFTGKENENIDLQISKNGHKVVLVYQDNGPGLPNDFDSKKEGLGLLLINLLAKQLKGTCEFSSDNELKCVIKFTLK